MAALDEFLAGATRRPLIRLVANGTPLSGRLYTSRIRLGGSTFDDVIDPSKVADEFANGATVVAQSLHRTHNDVRRFVRSLAQEISHPLQANSYLTPPNSTGLAEHADRHDVFVLQIEGSKQWTVDGLGTAVVRAGDALYIPAGARHSATSTDTASLHLTIGILRVTYRAVLHRILHDGPSVLDDPLPLRYRRGADDARPDVSQPDVSQPDDASDDASDCATDCTIGPAPDDAPGYADMIAEVIAHLGNVDVDAVAARERARPTVSPPDSGALVAAVDIVEITARHTISPLRSDWTISETGGERVRLAVGNRQLTAPAACEPALRQLTGMTGVRVGDLVGLDGPSCLVLARRLVAARFCSSTATERET